MPINLTTKQALDTDPKIIEQNKCTANLDGDENSKNTNFGFLTSYCKRIVNTLLNKYNKIT